MKELLFLYTYFFLHVFVTLTRILFFCLSFNLEFFNCRVSVQKLSILLCWLKIKQYLSRTCCRPRLVIQKLFFSANKPANSFFFKFFEDTSPFCEATETRTDVTGSPKVSKPGWIPRLRALSPACNGLLRFTAGATPADLLSDSMAAKPFVGV